MLDDAAEDVVWNDSPEDAFAFLFSEILEKEGGDGGGATDADIGDEVPLFEVNENDAVSSFGYGEGFAGEPSSEELLGLEAEFAEEPSEEAVEFEAVSASVV